MGNTQLKKSRMIDNGWLFTTELVYTKKTTSFKKYYRQVKWAHNTLQRTPVSFRIAVKIAFPPAKQLSLF